MYKISARQGRSIMRLFSKSHFPAWILIGSILCILSLCAYPTILRSLDATVCFTRIADQLGTEPTYDAISQRIVDNLSPGIGRNEVIEYLSRIGSVKSTGTRTLALNEGIEEGLKVSACLHPMNNFLILIQYTRDERLISSLFYEWP